MDEMEAKLAQNYLIIKQILENYNLVGKNIFISSTILNDSEPTKNKKVKFKIEANSIIVYSKTPYDIDEEPCYLDPSRILIFVWTILSIPPKGQIEKIVYTCPDEEISYVLIKDTPNPEKYDINTSLKVTQDIIDALHNRTIFSHRLKKILKKIGSNLF